MENKHWILDKNGKHNKDYDFCDSNSDYAFFDGNFLVLSGISKIEKDRRPLFHRVASCYIPEFSF